MEVPHRLRAQALGLVPGFQPVYSALFQQLLVELLQIQRSEFFQREFADIGFDVVVDVTPVGLMGGWPHLHLGIVLKPHLHPLANRIPPGLGRVQPLRFLNGGFQLCFCLRLGLAQDILVDGLACVWIPAGGVPTLPAAVLPFAEVTLPV